MILSELRDYLKQQQRVSLADLVNHFHVDADALRGMLKKWIAKGSVRMVTMESACGTSCCKCDPSLIELYEWLDK
jgi:hypothetical protein